MLKKDFRICKIKSSPSWNQNKNLSQNMKMKNGSQFSTSVGLTAHLCDLNMCLQGKSHLICAVTQ